MKKLNTYQIRPIRKKKRSAFKQFLKQMIGFRPRIALIALAAIILIISVYYTFRSEAATAWPLKISSNGHYLVDQSGKAYLYTADTSWYMISHLTVADAKKVIDKRKSQGFNAIQSLLTGWSWKEKIGPRGQVFTGHNITTPNEEFFKGMDEIVAYAKSQDMVLLIGPVAAEELITYSDADIQTYGTWLANRYKGSGNILWYVGSDRDPNVGLDKLKVLGNAIKAVDSNALITSHFFGLAKPFFLGGESWYGFYGFQWNGNGKPWCYEIANEGYNTTPTKPFLNLEPAYEPDAADGTKTTDLQVRTCAWGALLGGGMGISYGGPRDSWAIGEPNLNWAALDRPSATHAGNVNKIMSQFAWEKLVPDMDGKVVTGDRGSKGTNDFVPAGAAADGSLVAAYTPKARTLTVDMSKLSGPANAYWFDPTNASKTDAGANLPNSGSKTFASPSSNSAGESDFVLILTTSTPSTSTAPQVSQQPVTTPPYVCLGPCVPSGTPGITTVPLPSTVAPTSPGEEPTDPTDMPAPTDSSEPEPSDSYVYPSLPVDGDDNGGNNNGRKGLIALLIGFIMAILEFIIRLFR